jgi:hypothetical protein
MSYVKRAIKCGEKAAKVIFIANIVYFGGFLIGANGVHRCFSPPIKTESELELRLTEEKQRLGLTDSTIIHAHLSQNKKENSYAKKLAPNEYEINLEPVEGHNIAVLRHELYHIKDGHLDDVKKISDSFGGKIEKILKYVYINEPQAILYHMTGIKL